MSATPTIGLFTNSTAGKGKALAIAQQLVQWLQQQKVTYVLFNQPWPTDFNDITEAWIIGGDGTLNFFINYYQPQIPLTVFPAGTGNDFHWQLYGKIDLFKQAAQMLSSTPRPIDAIQCNDKMYVNSVGLGFDGMVLQSMQKIRFLGGHVGYLWIVLKTIFKFKEYRFTISVGEQIYQDKFLLVVVNNASRTGGGFYITPKAKINDGLLDMMLCKALPILERLRYLPVIEKGKHLALPFVSYQQTMTITVSCEQEILGQMDGELISGNQFTFNILPGRFFFK
jgi:YegS/Rv2252/BmrU family lipid kinase